MENNTFNITELYVGKVISVHLDTHELEVYVPKLMPTLNYGFSNTVYSVDLQSEVVKTNTLLCMTENFKDRVPDEGSLVYVYFLDGDIKKVYWRDFDPFGTNTYIEFEKIGNEKTLEDFANTFDASPTSLIPKDVGVMLGSSDKPFSEIFGNISSEYVVGLDDKLKALGESIASSITFDPNDINLKTLREIIVVNNVTGNIPLIINAIENTTANLADFRVNGVTKASINSDGNINVKSVTLDNAPGPITWGTSSETMEIPMGNGVVQQVGEEIYYPKVINMSGFTIPNGTPVRSDGMYGEYTKIVPMIADNSVDRFLYMGLATQELAHMQTGRVTYFGRVGDLNTSQYVSGTPLYVSTTVAGELTDVKPISPNYAIPVGTVRAVDMIGGSINVRYNYLPKASEVTYDRAESELEATNVQSAIDELQSSKASLSALSSNISLYPTSANSDISTYKKMVRSTLDPDYDSVAVDIPTGTIIASNQLIATLASEDNLIVGNPGIVNITTLGNIRKISGNSQQYAEFYFELYLRNLAGVETLIGTSNTTGAVNPYDNGYYQFSAIAILNNGEWLASDRMVIKYYANVLGNSGSAYTFQFGGNTPVRTLIPVPVEVIPSDVASEILTDTSAFNKILSSVDDNVQKALNRLDDHEHADLYIGKTNGTGTETTINNNAIGDVPLNVNAIAGTTANLQEWKINNSVLAHIKADGTIVGTGAIIDNVRIGVTGTNTINTVTGDLIIDSASGTTTINDNLIISGDLTVQGTNTILNTTTVSTEDDLIVLRSAATPGLPMTSFAGIVTKFYDGVNSGALVYDNAGILKIGDVTLNGDGSITDVSMQAVATREDSTTLNAIPYWSADGAGKLLSSGMVTDPATGNIAIGTTTNTYKLRVAGTGFFSSTLAATLFQDSSNGAYYLDPANTGTSLNVAGDAILGNRLFAKTLYLWPDTTGSYITNEIGVNTTAIKLQTKGNQPISLSSGTGGVGINTDAPSGQLEVKSSSTTKAPLILDTQASHTANIQEWKVNGTAQSWIENDGSFRVGEVRNKTTVNNSRISLNNTGTNISRNVADTNTALNVNLENAGATGYIATFQKAGINQVAVDSNGTVRLSAIYNMTSGNNAAVSTATTGTIISRNIGDANTALKTQISHTDSTGNIQEWHSNIGGSTALRARVTKDGSFYTNNLVVDGDLTVHGNNTILNTGTLTTEDDLIVVRSAGALGTPILSYAGLVAKYYDGTNSGALVFDNSGTAYIGDVTLNGDGSITDVSMQPIVTRSSLTDGFIPYWEGSSSSLTNSNVFYDTATGRVGIGTSTPGVTLDVSGAIRSSGVFYGSSLNSGSGESFAISGDDLVFNAAGSEKARIVGATGNLGIGLNNPGQKLHVFGSGVIKGTIQSTDNQVQLELSGTLGQIFNTNGPLYITNNDSNDDMIFRVAASTEKMRLTAAGNLGVGESNPLGQLDVKASTTEKVPMILNTLASHTANLQEWKVNGTTLASMSAAGTLTMNDIVLNASKTAKTFYAAPNAAAGVPSFRTIVASDIPTLNQSTTGQAGSVAQTLIIKSDNGTTEGTNQYTYNGSTQKTINFMSGNAITIAETANTLTINHTDTSTQASLSTLTGSNVVSAVGLDTYGHITSIETRALNLGDLGYVAPTVNNGQLTMSVSGVGLSGSATFTANQSGNSTFTVTSNATPDPTANTIVARDASGNIKANDRYYYNTYAYTVYNSVDKSIDFVFTN